MSGPGAVTADGCPVEVYRRLPALGEADLVHVWAGPGARVLDLGAGVGRIADPLVELGHHVVAVDNSGSMLAAVRRARPHLGEIAGLRLAERFDVVLLASHLVNTPDDGLRHELLATAARHLSDGGRLVAQWHPQEWFDRLRPGEVREGLIGDLVCRFTVRSLVAGVLDAEVRYTAASDSWTQPFRASRLTTADLDRALAGAGLCRDPLDPDHPEWFAARRTSNVH